MLSPEPWGKIFISKHNYAIALARRRNEVYFFNSVRAGLLPGKFSVRESGYSNLKIVEFRPPFPLALKFHAKKLYGYLMNLYLKYISKALALKPDIIWDFNSSYEYGDLSAFHPAFTIFQPVDQIRKEMAHKKADVLVTISAKIADQYQNPDAPKLVVSHGVAENFVQLALRPPQSKNNKPLRAGYIGNLCIESLDRNLLIELIQNNTDVEFHLVGPYGASDNNLGTAEDSESNRFFSFLKEAKNVILYGAKTQPEVAALLDGFDINLICYKATPTYQSDNSHKVLEYMAAGKVLVSTYLSNYEGSKLIEMSKGGVSEFLELFAGVKNNIDSYNTVSRQQDRKQLALDNSYDKQIAKIETFIAGLRGEPRTVPEKKLVTESFS